jgi:hypothetical protein
MNGLFAAVGVVDPLSVRLNGRGYAAMFRVLDSRFYLSGLSKPPACGDLFVLGQLYSFRAVSCKQHHTGIRPFVVLPAEQVSPDVINSLVAQWISAVVGY